MASQNKPTSKHCVGSGVGGGDGNGVGAWVGFHTTTTTMLLVSTVAPAIELEIDDVKDDAAKSAATLDDTVAASSVLDCTVKVTSQVTDVASSRGRVYAGPMLDMPTPTTEPVLLPRSKPSSNRLALTLVEKALMSEATKPIPDAIASLTITSLSSAGALVATMSKVVTTWMVSSAVGAIDGTGVGCRRVGMGVAVVGTGTGANDGIHVKGVGSYEIEGTLVGSGDGASTGECVGSGDAVGIPVVGDPVGSWEGAGVGFSDGDGVGAGV